MGLHRLIVAGRSLHCRRALCHVSLCALQWLRYDIGMLGVWLFVGTSHITFVIVISICTSHRFVDCHSPKGRRTTYLVSYDGWQSTARQIQSKRTEFVCPSSTRPQSAGSERHSAARQIQSKRTEFVCQSSTRPHIILSLVQYECKGRD